MACVPLTSPSQGYPRPSPSALRRGTGSPPPRHPRHRLALPRGRTAPAAHCGAAETRRRARIPPRRALGQGAQHPSAHVPGPVGAGEPAHRGAERPPPRDAADPGKTLPPVGSTPRAEDFGQRAPRRAAGTGEHRGRRVFAASAPSERGPSAGGSHNCRNHKKPFFFLLFFFFSPPRSAEPSDPPNKKKKINNKDMENSIISLSSFLDLAFANSKQTPEGGRQGARRGGGSQIKPESRHGKPVFTKKKKNNPPPQKTPSQQPHHLNAAGKKKRKKKKEKLNVCLKTNQQWYHF